MPRKTDFEFPQDFVQKIRVLVESVQGCQFIGLSFKEEKIADVNGDYHKTLTYLETSFNGWSESLHKIKITASSMIKNPKKLDFEQMHKDAEQDFKEQLNIQEYRSKIANKLGMDLPIYTTGQHLNEISHTYIDRTGYDYMLTNYGHVEDALLKICELNHNLHQVKEYNGKRMMVSKLFPIGGNNSQIAAIINDKCVTHHKLTIAESSSDKRFASFFNNELFIRIDQIPEIIKNSAIGRRLGDLIGCDHPVENRIITNIDSGSLTTIIKVKPEYLSVRNILKEHRLLR